MARTYKPGLETKPSHYEAKVLTQKFVDTSYYISQKCNLNMFLNSFLWLMENVTCAFEWQIESIIFLFFPVRFWKTSIWLFKHWGIWLSWIDNIAEYLHIRICLAALRKIAQMAQPWHEKAGFLLLKEGVLFTSQHSCKKKKKSHCEQAGGLCGLSPSLCLQFVGFSVGPQARHPAEITLLPRLHRCLRMKRALGSN